MLSSKPCIHQCGLLENEFRMSQSKKRNHQPASQVPQQNSNRQDLATTESTSKPISIRQLLASSIFLAVLTGIGYLNGTAFREGYYSYFNLDPTMFPLDNAGTITMGFRAWGEGLSAVLMALFSSAGKHWSGILLTLAFVGFSYGSLEYLIVWQRRRKGHAAAPPEDERPRLFKWMRKCFAWTALLGMFSATLLASLLAVTLSIGLLISPFEKLGRYEAKHEAGDQFKHHALVIIKSPGGVSGEYRKIACGPQFCALWGTGHATTVPVTAITWAESPPPEAN
ncbi:hypothetical protein [Dyella sp. Tek66A03]|uniref:hypothetical protein n=1 Tax=Dyella sp. Tek66A03 TaxID=3458298 RepID=UPI00403EB2AE